VPEDGPGETQDGQETGTVGKDQHRPKRWKKAFQEIEKENKIAGTTTEGALYIGRAGIPAPDGSNIHTPGPGH
jgi:hypothetical protein